MRYLLPSHRSYSEEYWGTECGTPEAEASMRCVKCWIDLAHPWHDSGEPNSEQMYLFESEGDFQRCDERPPIGAVMGGYLSILRIPRTIGSSLELHQQ